MKKVFKLSSLVLLLVCLATLVGCSKISQGYADKINKAADKNEHITYEEVKDALGDESVFVGVELLGSANGVVIAVKGCDSLEDIEAKVKEGKTVKGISIVIANNKAISAEYAEISEEDLK